MADVTTIARPYAKAIFEHALSAKNLEQWSHALYALSQSVLTPEAAEFIANPASTVVQHIDLLQAVINSKDEGVNNIIRLLANNKRLMILPAIKVLYEFYKSDFDKTLTVEVISFSALSKTQEQKLIDSLSKRLKRKVSLNVRIDSALIGGAVLRAGHLVIDGSILSKLNKLNADLVA